MCMYVACHAINVHRSSIELMILYSVCGLCCVNESEGLLDVCAVLVWVVGRHRLTAPTRLAPHVSLGVVGRGSTATTRG